MNVGELLATLKLDTSQYESALHKAGVSGEDAVTKSKKQGDSIGKSMFLANIATDLFRKGVDLLKDAFADSLKEYSQSEKIMSQLSTTLKSTGYAAGMTSEGIKNLASNLSDLTGIDKDNIVSAETILLRYTKIGKEVFPQATKAILDMSVAKKIDLDSSAKLIGRLLETSSAMGAAARQGIIFTDEEKKLGKQLEDSGKSAEYQALVLKALDRAFGGSAVAARDTFGGALSAAKVAIEDTEKAIGFYIAKAGKPFVENAILMTKSVEEFLKSKKGIEIIGNIIGTISGTLNVAGEVFGKFFKIFKENGADIFKGVAEDFSKLTGKGNEANVTFNILGGVIQVAAIGFAVGGKIVKLFIMSIADLIVAVKKSVDVLGAFGAALLDPLNKEKWQAVADKAKDAANAFVDFGKGVVENYKDIIVTTINEFNNFEKNSSDTTKKLTDSYTKGFKAVKDGLASQNSAVKESTEKAIIESNKETAVINQNYKDIGKSYQELEDQKSKGIKDQEERTKKAKEDTDKQKKFFEDLGKSASDVWNNIKDVAGSYFNYANSLLQEQMTAEQQASKDFEDADRSDLEKSIYNLDIEKEKYLAAGVDKNKVDKWYNKELSKLTATATKEELANIDNITATQAAAAKKDYDDKRAYEMKKYQAQVDAFNWNKAISAVDIGIKTVQAAMTAFASLGWPWGLIPAGIVTAMGIAQEAFVISQQPPPPPAFASGGWFASPDTGIDKGTARLTAGEFVVNKNDAARNSSLLENINSGGTASSNITLNPVPVNIFLSDGKLIGRADIEFIQQEANNGGFIIPPKAVRARI